MKDIHDLIVLGGGPAGRTAAIIARRTGASVLLVEQGPLGGTCPLRGCIPKKVLVTSAEIMDDIGLAQRHRVATGEVCLDWNGLISRKREILAPSPRVTGKGSTGSASGSSQVRPGLPARTP